VKFTPQGGYIDFSMSFEKEKGPIFVSIKNSGAGISSEDLNKVFDRFYKADKARSYDSKSAGLGLYLVKSILDLHGGSISVSSEEGKYTEFTFSLPG
jgi:signal transduction histidine kinase